MTCAKKQVKATLLLRDGSIFYGTNDCQNPQPVCPRGVSEGYTKCGIVCRQLYHAEIHAMVQAAMAGKCMEGGHMLVMHHRVCGDCGEQMGKFGITWETRT